MSFFPENRQKNSLHVQKPEIPVPEEGVFLDCGTILRIHCNLIVRDAFCNIL